MNWIKTHYEKIVLALVLVLLIVSAAALSVKVGHLSQEVRDLPRRSKPKTRPTQPANLGTYTAVIGKLEDPPLWTNGDRAMFSKDTLAHNPDENPTISTNNLPALVQVSYTPFNLLFKAYTGEGRYFQLNFLTWSKSFLVREVGDEVADRYVNTVVRTGYFIKKFDLKKVPAPSGMGEQDLSELTLQHEGEDPIVLVYNKVTASKEPIARIVCPGTTQLQEVHRTQIFRCGDSTYNVVDINPKQMIIKEMKSGVQETIPLSAPKK